MTTLAFPFRRTLFALVVLLVPGHANGHEPPAVKTLTRVHDHVVIQGEHLTGCLGADIRSLMLFAYHDGVLKPIPFQVDEITADHHWVLPHASPYEEDRERGADKLLLDDPPEILDANDELAFMISDTGGRAPVEAYPVGWQAGDEIEISDPLDGGKAWVYLFWMAQPATPSPANYVQYDLAQGYKRDRIRGKNYDLGFNPEVPITYAMIHLRNEAGAQENLVDRMKIRVHARLLRVFRIERNEEDMNSRLWQYKDGPVRVIRMVRSSIRLIANLQSPEVASYSLYYKNAAMLPFRVNIPFDVRFVAKDLRFSGGMDFRSLYGWKIRLNTDPRWLTVDGRMDEIERDLQTEGARWFALKGEQGAVLFYVQGLERYGIQCRFIYLDDDQTPAPPEFEVGQVPLVAFKAEGLEKLGKGTIEFHALVFFINHPIGEDELVELADQLETPVTWKVLPLPHPDTTG